MHGEIACNHIFKKKKNYFAQVLFYIEADTSHRIHVTKNSKKSVCLLTILWASYCLVLCKFDPKATQVFSEEVYLFLSLQIN